MRWGALCSSPASAVSLQQDLAQVTSFLSAPVSSPSPCPRNLFFKLVKRGISQDTSWQTTWQKILEFLAFGRVQITVWVVAWVVMVSGQAKVGSLFVLSLVPCPSHADPQSFVALGRRDCSGLCPPGPSSWELVEQQFQESL